MRVCNGCQKLIIFRSFREHLIPIEDGKPEMLPLRFHIPCHDSFVLGLAVSKNNKLMGEKKDG